MGAATPQHVHVPPVAAAGVLVAVAGRGRGLREGRPQAGVAGAAVEAHHTGRGRTTAGIAASPTATRPQRHVKEGDVRLTLRVFGPTLFIQTRLEIKYCLSEEGATIYRCRGSEEGRSQRLKGQALTQSPG